jgi:hypothetical protein
MQMYCKRLQYVHSVRSDDGAFAAEEKRIIEEAREKRARAVKLVKNRPFDIGSLALRRRLQSRVPMTGAHLAKYINIAFIPFHLTCYLQHFPPLQIAVVIITQSFLFFSPRHSL